MVTGIVFVPLYMGTHTLLGGFVEVRTLELPLKGFGAPPTLAHVEFLSLSAVDRFKRAGMILGACLLAAIIFIPVPLVHLIIVPGALILGVVFALIRLQQREIFRSVVGRCPFCGTEQRFTALGRFRIPKALTCSSCRRQVVLEEPTSEVPRSPT
jgi:hypothetical protein